MYKKISGSAVTFFVLYVDNILLIENDIFIMMLVKVWLSKEFIMKDLKEAFYILGIKVYRNRSKRMIGLSKHMYIEKVLKRFSMETPRGVFCPLDMAFISPRRCVQTHLRRSSA